MKIFIKNDFPWALHLSRMLKQTKYPQNIRYMYHDSYQLTPGDFIVEGFFRGNRCHTIAIYQCSGSDNEPMLIEVFKNTWLRTCGNRLTNYFHLPVVVT